MKFSDGSATGVVNGIYRNQDLFSLDAFTYSFDIFSFSNTVGDAGYLVMGASGVTSSNYPTANGCAGNVYCVVFQIYTGGGRAKGIYLMYNGIDLAASAIDVAQGAWKTVAVRYDRNAAHHFVVTYDGSTIITYTDPSLTTRLASLMGRGTSGQHYLGWFNGAARGTWWFRKVVITCS